MNKIHHPLDRSQRLQIKKKKQVADAEKNEVYKSGQTKTSKRLIKAVLQDKETQDELKRVDIGSILG